MSVSIVNTFRAGTLAITSLTTEFGESLREVSLHINHDKATLFVLTRKDTCHTCEINYDGEFLIPTIDDLLNQVRLVMCPEPTPKEPTEEKPF